MNNIISKLAAGLDTKRDFLLHIKDAHPDFYIRLNAYLKDKLTFSDLEQALVNVLSTIGITIYMWEDLSLHIEHTTSSGKILHENFDDYESALHFAIALFYTKQI